MKSISKYILFVLFASISTAWANIHLNLVGRVETGMLMDQELTLDVKMDTGAKTASLSAHDIKIFNKDDVEWVSFMIDSTRVEKEYRFEYPLKRMVRIKKRQSEQADSTQAYERRPVVEMKLCLGKEVETIEVSLTDRSNFMYPMLLGRSGMKSFAILIDPTAIRTTKPTCDIDPVEKADQEDTNDDETIEVEEEE